MGATKNIRAVYGGNSKQSMNRAIRAEKPGGEAMLRRVHILRMKTTTNLGLRRRKDGRVKFLDEMAAIKASWVRELRAKYA